MLVEDNGTDKGDSKGAVGDSERQKRYGIIVIALIVLAVAFSLLTGVVNEGNCKGIVIAQSRDICLLSLATSTNNATLCSALQGNQAAQCYSDIAYATSRYQLCQNVSAYDPAGGSSCYEYFANLTGNAQLCNHVEEPGMSQCFLQAAVKNYDSYYCSEIKNSSSSRICTDSVALNSALRIDNVSYCAALNGTYNSTETNVLLADITGKQKSMAANLYSESTYFSYSLVVNYSKRDICYLFFSALESGGNYCDSINNTNLQGVCASSSQSTATGPAQPTNSTNSTAYYNHLLALCTSQPSNLSMTCQTSVLLLEAVQTKNATICANLQPTVDTTCYDSLATTYSNATYCTYIGNSSEEYSCLLGVHGANSTS